MATGTQQSGKSSRQGQAKSSGGSKDAIALLKADHREVEKLFKEFESAKDDSRKEKLAGQICNELRVHTRIEEEIFYPESREFLKDEEIVNEAIVEHQSAKELIEQIEGLSPSDEMYEAKMTVLQEMIEHHVEEEEKEFFPQVQKSDMDTKEVGERLESRKKELKAQMDGDGRPMH